MFSTCVDKSHATDGVCTAYGDRTSRQINGEDVEFTVYNVLTKESNLDEDTYDCLTLNHPDRLYHASEVDTELTLSEMTEQLEKFKEEICNVPTQDPTSDPTVDPTRDPSRDPTSDPTSDPTNDPTQNPTLPRCECENLGYELEWIECDTEGGGCPPVGECDFTPICNIYDILLNLDDVPGDNDARCKYESPVNSQLVPHQPQHIIIAAPFDCPITMSKFNWWNVVQSVKGGEPGTDLTDLNFEELEDVDPLADIAGIKIPIAEFFPGINSNGVNVTVYRIEICLYGVKDYVFQKDENERKTDDHWVNIGWVYDDTDLSGDDIAYGYNCPATIKIPNVCEDAKIYARSPGKNNQPLDMLRPKPGSNNNMDETHSPNSFFELYTAYSLWVLAAVVAIFALNVVVCVYIKCIAPSSGTGSGKKKVYGFISGEEPPKFDDRSDSTDSEWDSQSD
eukprot:TRINITY_DN293_c0_g1_i1.p1 TRINITY_DN293_c0_g1~~TRINITY_DN293_c0_g1_i1.p1  ORF type:complete len:451 (+),score=116.67 TRINITY_DN293_c0_g1_i1:13-1365(+)